MKRDFDGFRVTVDVVNPGFAQAPTAFQREWTLRRALFEFGTDLAHLDQVVQNFVPGVERPPITDSWEASAAAYDDRELVIQDQQVMQAWEHPLMKALAVAAAERHGDVLEVGFGMAISASYLLAEGVRSYSVIECNEGVIRRFERWREGYPDIPMQLFAGRWQDVIPQLGLYDGILFDTYPLSQEEYLRNEVHGTAYSHAGEFFPVAAAHLRPGGVFTYFTCEIDTLSRGHQRLLLQHFDAFTVRVVRGLQPPEGCQYWWADSMAVVQARKAL